MSTALSALGSFQETASNGGTKNAVQWKQDRGGIYKGQTFDAGWGISSFI